MGVFLCLIDIQISPIYNENMKMETEHTNNRKPKTYTTNIGTWYYCGCYTLTASGKRVYLKSNVNYDKEHPKHKPRCLYKETKA